MLGDEGEPGAHGGVEGADLFGVGGGVGGVGGGVGGIGGGEGGANVFHVNERVGRRHPGVGVGLVGVGALGDGHGLDAGGEHGGRHVFHVAEELLEPGLQVHAVPEHEVGSGGAHDVLRGGLVAVDLGAGLGERVHVGDVARHVARHVGDDGECSDDLDTLAGPGLGGVGGERGEGGQKEAADGEAETRGNGEHGADHAKTDIRRN